MLSHLLGPENAPFLLALALFLLLGIVQIAALLIGTEIFSFADDWFADADVGDVDVSPGLFESVMSVLGIGKVPLIITFLLFLFSFAFAGYNVQLTLKATSGEALPAWAAGTLALLVSLPVVRLGNELFARILPRDETAAVSEETFIGKIAVITIGTATRIRSAEAKLQDDLGNIHYVQVLSEVDGETFSAGEEVVLVGREGSRFTVVRGPAGLLKE